MPYLLTRLSYQARVLRSMSVKWPATSFLIRLWSTPMASEGALAGGIASRVWRAVASSEASMALSDLLVLVRLHCQFLHLDRGGDVVVGLVFLVAGGLGSLDLGIQAGERGCKLGLEANWAPARSLTAI